MQAWPWAASIVIIRNLIKSARDTHFDLPATEAAQILHLSSALGFQFSSYIGRNGLNAIPTIARILSQYVYEASVLLSHLPELRN